MNDEGPDEHDAHLFDDDGNDCVACPECGKQILAVAPVCHRCKAQFVGEAWEGHVVGRPAIGLPNWVICTAVIVVIAFILWAVL